MKPKALVLRAAGTNCDAETAHGFELAGASAEVVHLNRLLDRGSLLDEYQILAIPGGFSYGDDISAGRILANQITLRLGDVLREFVRTGKPVIGICNGFQVLVKTDLLPGRIGEIHGRSCTLTQNDCGRYVDRWVTLSVRSRKCVWTRGVDGLELPVGHGEGKFVTRDETVRRALWDNDQVALVYTQPGGAAAQGRFPDNPNGSVDDIAGICDDTGLVFGLMPHPDRYLSAQQHPGWSSRACDSDKPREGMGVQVFAGAVRSVAT